jgi:hypothetical protein
MRLRDISSSGVEVSPEGDGSMGREPGLDRVINFLADRTAVDAEQVGEFGQELTLPRLKPGGSGLRQLLRPVSRHYYDGS